MAPAVVAMAAGPLAGSESTGKLSTLNPSVTVFNVRLRWGTDGANVEREGSRAAEFTGNRNVEDRESDCLILRFVIHPVKYVFSCSTNYKTVSDVGNAIVKQTLPYSRYCHFYQCSCSRLWRTASNLDQLSGTLGRLDQISLGCERAHVQQMYVWVELLCAYPAFSPDNDVFFWNQGSD